MIAPQHDALAVATEYTRRGLSVLPLLHRDKNPRNSVGKGWQKLRLAEGDLPKWFNGKRQNIGVHNGEPSAWQVDVDVDHRLAVELADLFLPATPAVFGRAGKPRSHWLFRLSRPAPTKQWDHPQLGMILELRSTGSQTVFPGSTHESGEPIEWHSDEPPVEIDPDPLIAACQALVDAVCEAEGVETVGREQPRPSEPRKAADPLHASATNSPAVQAYVRKAVDAELQAVVSAPKPGDGTAGARNTTLFKASCRLAELVAAGACDRGYIEPQLMRAGLDAGLSHVEAHRTISSGIARGLKKPRDLSGVGQKGSGERRQHASDEDAADAPYGPASDDDESDQEQEESAASGPPWPEPLGDAAYHGPLGELVRAIEPHTEADPAGVLIQSLAAYGNVIGRSAYFSVEATRHYGNLFVCLVGQTAAGRKGTSLDQSLRVFETVDQHWATNCVAGGMSSGEGVIWAVRDAIFKREPVRGPATKGRRGAILSYEETEIDPGVQDKRLLAVETEFGSVLRVMARQTNTLSTQIRQAWDTGNLRVMTKHSAARATGAHISIVGHVTAPELRKYLLETDAFGGVGNRYLWPCVRRSKLLPEGGNLASVDFFAITTALKAAIDFARSSGEIKRDLEARTIWHDGYAALSSGRHGLLGACTSRAEAQVTRLSLLYALLDCSPEIQRPHLEAALEVWRYCLDSARHVFGDSTGDATADRILAALRRAGDQGMSRTEITKLFGGNKPSTSLEGAIALLHGVGLARNERSPREKGRPEVRWYAC